MKKIQFLSLLILSIFAGIVPSAAQSHGTAAPTSLQTINTGNADELMEFFSFSPDRIPLISAHRGGPRPGFPENCFATFENTLRHTPALLEIDPRYTKDGEIVLMHDLTLDRTTNGKGKVTDYTLAELKELRLKDTEGNLTDFQIPTLDEALQWAIGKTILVIDEKDVPIDIRVKKILENKAQANAIVIAYSLEDIKNAYQIYPKIMMEVMMGKMENVTAFDQSGVPWANAVGFVSHNLPVNKEIIKAVHERGAMCIQGSSRNYDRDYTSGKINGSELKTRYQEIIEAGADIIEADLGIEAGEAIKQLQEKKSSKSKFFSF